MTATKRKPRYTIEIAAPVNGRIRQSTVLAIDRNGKTWANDKGDLSKAAECRRVGRELARQLGEEDAAPIIEAIETKWKELLDQQRRLYEQAAAGSPEAMQEGPATPPSAATRLVALALESGALLTHAPDGQAHLTVNREGRRGNLVLAIRGAFGCCEEAAADRLRELAFAGQARAAARPGGDAPGPAWHAPHGGEPAEDERDAPEARDVGPIRSRLRTSIGSLGHSAPRACNNPFGGCLPQKPMNL
jgi:hypothetical protein